MKLKIQIAQWKSDQIFLERSQVRILVWIINSNNAIESSWQLIYTSIHYFGEIFKTDIYMK